MRLERALSVLLLALGVLAVAAAAASAAAAAVAPAKQRDHLATPTTGTVKKCRASSSAACVPRIKASAGSRFGRAETSEARLERSVRAAAAAQQPGFKPVRLVARRKSSTSGPTSSAAPTEEPPSAAETADESSDEGATEDSSGTSTAACPTSSESDKSEPTENDQASDESADQSEDQAEGSESAQSAEELVAGQDEPEPDNKASGQPAEVSAGSKARASKASEPDTKTEAGAPVHHKRKPLVALPFIKPKNASACTSEAFLEFPRDVFGDKWRSRGFVLVHLLVVCYMFYALALVCERYFMPSLEEFAQRLNLSEDVAGATLMSAGSSAPELFTAILGVFVAKGDVGTGAIVGSAVFNILFVIGLCAFVSTTTAQLQWWPVLRDSLYYTFTVLVLILIIYDERVTAVESFFMLALYGVYITIMVHNETLKEVATRLLASHPFTEKIVAGSSAEGPDDVFGGSSSAATGGSFFASKSAHSKQESREMNRIAIKQTRIEDDSMYMAALLTIIKHKRLFRSTIRFQSAARYVIVKMQHRQASKQQQKPAAAKQASEVDYIESKPLRPATGATASASQRSKMEAYAHGGTMSKNKFSIVSRDDYEFWNRPPADDENYYIWLAKIPVNYVLHHTIPDCALYPDKYVYTFVISIIWTAFFSYIMVWMVTLVGYTFGIPDSVMGVTFLAAGTSVPDCYSSIHAARNGMADMAVSNSIGSNVFDILIGLAVPWFIQSAIYPGVVATINSRGVIYSVVLLFLSLIVTIYLLNKYEWNLQPRLGLALLIAYGLFIVLTCMLEFNLFGHVNPPPCIVPANRI